MVNVFRKLKRTFFESILSKNFNILLPSSASDAARRRHGIVGVAWYSHHALVAKEVHHQVDGPHHRETWYFFYHVSTHPDASEYCAHNDQLVRIQYVLFWLSLVHCECVIVRRRVMIACMRAMIAAWSAWLRTMIAFQWRHCACYDCMHAAYLCTCMRCILKME